MSCEHGLTTKECYVCMSPKYGEHDTKQECVAKPQGNEHMSIEAMKQWLKALEEACGDRCNAEYNPCHARTAITSLRAALDWKSTPCHDWKGRITPQGYGELSANKNNGGGNLRAHRVVWEALNGPIPEGMVIDHLCRNRSCVNPMHLEPVTVKENNLRGEGVGAKNMKKTECKSGHPFDESNTGWLGNGKRFCRQCNKIASQKYFAKKKGVSL